MAEPELTMPSAKDQDLPRTLRRAKAEQRRESLEREQAEPRREAAAKPDHPPADRARAHIPQIGSQFRAGEYAEQSRYQDDGEDEVTITRIRVPFFHLMGFFMKAALASVPALILIGAILYGITLLIQRFLPWLQPQLFILFP